MTHKAVFILRLLIWAACLSLDYEILAYFFPRSATRENCKSSKRNLRICCAAMLSTPQSGYCRLCATTYPCSATLLPSPLLQSKTFEITFQQSPCTLSHRGLSVEVNGFTDKILYIFCSSGLGWRYLWRRDVLCGRGRGLIMINSI